MQKMILHVPYFERRDNSALQYLSNVGVYLESLSSDIEYHPTEDEDWSACQMLIEIELPDQNQRIAHFILNATDPRCHRSRTLEVWRDILAQIAKMIQVADRSLQASAACH